MWPQYIYLVIIIFALGVSAGTHGQERTPENFFITLPASAFGMWLLYMGGFFSKLF
jgi:hypothetical protein